MIFTDQREKDHYDRIQAMLLNAESQRDQLVLACKDALGVLTEPGIMDVDEWKGWQNKCIFGLRAAISKATGGAQ